MVALSMIPALDRAVASGNTAERLTLLDEWLVDDDGDVAERVELVHRERQRRTAVLDLQNRLVGSGRIDRGDAIRAP